MARKTTQQHAQKQASSVIRQMISTQSINTDSARTIDNIQSDLQKIALDFREDLSIALKNITVEQAQQYIVDRAVELTQPSLDRVRETLDKLLHHTQKLSIESTLEKVRSEKETVLSSRSYTQEQISLIAESQREQNSLSTEIASAAGLRAHELLTIERIDERAITTVENKENLVAAKFGGRDANYTVQGKGGLVREIHIPGHLSERLEARRLDTPRQITDRGVRYEQKYEINGGQKWSNSFSQASNRNFGWSNGGHGLRHTYAQQRMNSLAQQKISYNDARLIVSRELGHFRAYVVEIYLR